jgi:hypothetical protein
MEIKVYRCPNNFGTPGAIFVDDTEICLSLEPHTPKEGETRIKGNCAAPLGKYKVIPRFEGEVFGWMKEKIPDVALYGIPHIMNIDGLTYAYWINGRGIQPEQDVLIHIGNKLSDTLGCLLTGTAADSENTMTGSTVAFQKLFDIIKEPMKNGNLTIEYSEV